MIGIIIAIVLVVVVLVPLGTWWVLRARAQGSSMTWSPRKRAEARAKERIERRRLGYRYADDSIFIHGDSVYCLVAMPTEGDDLATDDETGAIALRPVQLYAQLVKLFDGKPVQCAEFVRYRTISSTEWAQKIISRAWRPSALFKALIPRIAEHIETATPIRVWALQVRLGTAPSASGRDPLAGLTSFVTGVSEERFLRRDLAPFWDKAAQLERVVDRHGAVLASRDDLLWFIRKPGHGHLPVPANPETQTRPWRGGFFELAAVLRSQNLGGGVLQMKQRNRQSGEDDTSYSATLVVADQPPRMIFHAENNWGRRVAELDNPPEITWRYELIPPALWSKKATKFIGNVEDEDKDRRKAGASPDRAFEARQEQAANLRESTGDDPPPGMVGRLRLTVSAPTRGDLAKAIDEVKTAMGDIHVEVAEPAPFVLLEEQLPGGANQSDLGSLSAGASGGLSLWERHTDIYQPALGLFGSQSEVGDTEMYFRGRRLGWIGFFLGWMKKSGAPFHLDFHVQLALLSGAGVFVAGASGSGKTTAMMTIWFYCTESGVVVPVLDPKLEFRNFICYLCFGPQVLKPGFIDAINDGTAGTPGSPFQPVNRQLWEDTRLIDLAFSARGAEDPWVVTDNFIDGYNLALTIVDILFARDDHIQIVTQALREIHEQYETAIAEGDDFRAGLGDVIPLIEAERDLLKEDLERVREGNTGSIMQARAELAIINDVLARLKNGLDRPFIRTLLGFGTDPRPSDEHRDNLRRIVYTMSGYREPASQDPKEWTEDDRNAAAVMHVVLNELSGQDSVKVPHPMTGAMETPPRGNIVDEAPMVTSQRPGRSFMRRESNQGRSKRRWIAIMDQRTKGLSDIREEARADGDESNQFPTIMIFRQKTLGEARLALRVLRDAGDDLDGRTVDRLAHKLVEPRLEPGQCMVRDATGRVGVVVIDQLFKQLQRASQTNQELVAEDWSHPMPSTPEDWEIDPEGLLAVRRGIRSRTTDFDDDLDVDDYLDGIAESDHAPGMHAEDAPNLETAQ